MKRIEEEGLVFSESSLQKLEDTLDMNDIKKNEEHIQTQMTDMAQSSLKGMHKQLKESQALIEESLEADDNNSKAFAEVLAQCIKQGFVYTVASICIFVSANDEYFISLRALSASCFLYKNKISYSKGV